MSRHGYVGAYIYMSDKRLQRYVDAFTGRQCVRESGTDERVGDVVAGMIGKRLL